MRYAELEVKISVQILLLAALQRHKNSDKPRSVNDIPFDGILNNYLHSTSLKILQLDANIFVFVSYTLKKYY